MKTTIQGYGAYLPRFQLPRSAIAGAWSAGGGRGHNALAGSDEDALTMAVEAAENALAEMGATGLEAVYVATTSAPYRVHSAAGVLAETVGAPETADVIDVGGSTRAATTALKTLLDGVESGRVGSGLLAASELVSPAPGGDLERFAGCGGAALVLGSGPGLAAIESVFGVSGDFVDRWQGADERYGHEYDKRDTQTQGYRRQVVKAVEGLLELSGQAIGDFDQVVLPWIEPRSPSLVARDVGITPAQLQAIQPLVDSVGDAGTASPLLGLVAVLEQAEVGQRVLVVSYGSGGSDAVSLLITGKRSGQGRSLAGYLGEVSEVSYTRALQQRGELVRTGEINTFGVPPMSPLVQRDAQALKQLRGLRCGRCGFVNFPPSMRVLCIRCGGTSLSDQALARRGSIYTFCVNYYLPPPLEAPLPVIIADLDDGVRFRALGTEMAAEDLQVEAPVELVLRVLSQERGMTLYGHKFRAPRGVGQNEQSVITTGSAAGAS